MWIIDRFRPQLLSRHKLHVYDQGFNLLEQLLMTAKIYHNPRCSKSRATMALLEGQTTDFKTVEYLTTPPSAAELREILDLLEMEPRQLMRRKEPEYRELNLDNPELDRDALIAAMVDHPRLMERPIVINNGKVRIGRPPESVLEIL